MRSLNNFRAEQPHQHAMYYLRLLMTEVAWTKDELREALDGEASLSLLITVSLSLSLNSRLRVPAVVPTNPSFHTQSLLEIQKLKLQWDPSECNFVISPAELKAAERLGVGNVDGLNVF